MRTTVHLMTAAADLTFAPERDAVRHSAGNSVRLADGVRRDR